MRKFNNHKTKDFDSDFERKRYQQLKNMQDAGIIKSLELKPKFVLQQKHQYVDEEGKTRTLREITYTPDYVYLEGSRLVAEDAKGFETEVFRIKRKMFMAKYPQYTFRTFYQKDSESKLTKRIKKWTKSQ